VSKAAVLLIDGPAGAGKTTLASALAQALDESENLEPQVNLIHMDDFYDGWDCDLDQAWRRLDREVLTPLATSGHADFRAYRWPAEGFTGRRIRLGQRPVLIVEGCGSAPLEADGRASLITWVDAPQHVRMRRLLDRDGANQMDLLTAWEATFRDHARRHRTQARAHLRFEFPQGLE
jgi:uridine kinase